MMEILDTVLQSFSSSSLLVALLVLILLFLTFSSQKDWKEPPGPKPLPLLGNLLQLDLKRLYITFLKLSKTYGSVFTIYLGPKKMVILAGYKTVKEALVNYAEEFGERDEDNIMHEFAQGNGILWSNGDSWKEMRHFALKNLRDFGMGRKACEDKITEECNYLVEGFTKFNGKAFNMTQQINSAVANIICSLMYGSRFEYDDPEFTSLVRRVLRNAVILGRPAAQVYSLYPWIGKWLPGNKEFYKLYDVNRKHNLAIFSRLKQTLNPQMCRCLVDAFLVHKQNLEDSGNTNSNFHDENLMMTVLNLFAAGTETTSGTIRWGLLLMAKHPEIQDQVQEELRRVIGSRRVQVQDRKNLPFTNAVIHETQRVANIVPTGAPHRTNRDVTFQGYFIKKGTSVLPLLTSVLYDESEWEKPYSFHPTHFLNKDGKFVKRNAFMVYSAGHRICPGESLARMELFIFFTTLLQHFRFTPSPGVSEDELDLTPCVGLTLNPLPHKLCAVPLM